MEQLAKSNTSEPAEPHSLAELRNKHKPLKNYVIVAAAIMLAVLLADQWLKIWVKTTLSLNEEIAIFGDWFLLHYTENPGMAFGIQFGGKYGKLLLTLFRILAVAFGFYILFKQIQKRAHIGLIVCIALILSGAIGNIIDSVFYGVVFSDMNHYSGGWFYGWVVDMLYFPLIEGYYPDWVPIKGGDFFIFFSPVFNIADAAISIGVFSILIFQKKFFPVSDVTHPKDKDDPVAHSDSVKKVLITGSNGLLGQKLIDLYLDQPNKELYAVGRGPNRHPVKSGYTYFDLDLSQTQELTRMLNQVKPDTLIHAAAMTQVDDCENNPELCYQMNVEVTQSLASYCAQQEAHCILVSTDFIFDGTADLYTEEALPNPLSVYGKSKMEAENKVQQSGADYSILRTVLVYGVVADMSRSNIVLWAKNALENNQPIQVVNDQWRMPTLAEDLAMGCFLAENKQEFGIFNISGKDLLRIDNLVSEVARFWNLNEELISTTDSQSLNQAAQRPPRTCFDLTKSRTVLGYEPRSFVEGLHIVQSQLQAHKP